MVRSIFLAIVLLAVATYASEAIVNQSASQTQQLNQRPIIGVLSQPINSTTNYIAASYIKFVEAGGARAVPVAWDQPQDQLKALLTSLNGILLPGGGNDLTDSNGQVTPFYLAVRYVVQFAEQANKNGTYFPIWAVCLSFEFVAVYYANDTSILTSGWADTNINHNVTFTSAANTSRLYSGMPAWMSQQMQNNAVVNFDHTHALPPAFFTSNSNLLNNLTILATANNSAGNVFVASYEHKVYPFYGTQFHAEKAPFEWDLSIGATHTPEAVYTAQYFENFFNLEARKNTNKFASQTDEYNALIYNYDPIRSNGTFVQKYVFPSLTQVVTPAQRRLLSEIRRPMRLADKSI